ncbi:MAG: tetratricopeptide repeat protein [Verrucomicrobia bacterium]|nr:tetratricopeptide repeat protein [Verrucomicrobiota bacterium]
MSIKPVIFISAVSRELRSARDVVAKKLAFLGYDAEWQDVFGTEQGDIKEMLRRRIDAAAGVVQLVGQCHGCEPLKPDSDFGRISYTQYEALYAIQRGKKVWFILLDENFPTDPHDPEADEHRQLQSAYRQRIRSGSYLWHSAATNIEIENHIFGLKNDLAGLRHRVKQWAILVLVLLIALTAGGAWLVCGQAGQTNSITEIKNQNEKLHAAVRELSQTVAKVSQTGDKEDQQSRLARAYAVLETKLQLPPGTLEKELPRFAEQLLQRSDTSAIDRANALFAVKKFAEAEAAALKAKDKALAAAGQTVKDTIAALELAGSAAEEQIHYVCALDHYRAAAALTSQQRDPIEWARVQHGITRLLYDQGDYRQAVEVLRPIINIRQRLLGPEHPDTLTSRSNLAAALIAQGSNAEAMREFRAVLVTRQRVLGPEHSDTLTSRSNLAAAFIYQGKYAEAEAESRAVLAIRQRVLGPEHVDTLTSRMNVANALLVQGKHPEAETEHRVVLAIRQRVLGPEHPDTLDSRMNFANALNAQAKHAEAEKEHRDVLAIRQRMLGPEHPDTLNSRSNLAAALVSQGKYADAEVESRAVLAVRQRVLGPEHPDVFQSYYNLAAVLAAPWKITESLTFARQAFDGWRKTLGETHTWTQQAKKLVERLEKAP